MTTGTQTTTIIAELVEWKCPACGQILKTPIRPASCSKERAVRSLARDHIIAGCPAYMHAKSTP